MAMPEQALVTIVLLRRLCVILCNAFLYPSFACTFVNILFSYAKKLTNAAFTFCEVISLHNGILTRLCSVWEHRER